jgi:hypothetical protein
MEMMSSCLELGKIKANLDVSIGEQIFDEAPVETGHASVVDGEAVRQQVFQLRIFDLRENFIDRFRPWAEDRGFESRQGVRYLGIHKCTAFISIT